MLQNENQIFWTNLEKIKDSHFLNDLDFSSSLNLSYKDYLKYREKAQFLPLDSVFALSEKMNFHFEDLLNPDFTIKVSDHSAPPLLERYTRATYSQTRPLVNILNYLETTKGARAKINLIRKFQLSEDFIKNENNKTNILLITDIVKYLAKNHNFTYKDFVKIGRRMPFLSTNSILKDRLTGHKSAFATLECFVYECTRLFDTNCSYRINEFSDSSAIVEVIPNKYILDELQIHPHEFGNEEVCLTKMGNISSVTMYNYGQNAKIRKISSIHQGSLSNKYEFDLSAFRKIESSYIPDNLLMFNSLSQKNIPN